MWYICNWDKKIRDSERQANKGLNIIPGYIQRILDSILIKIAFYLK